MLVILKQFLHGNIISTIYNVFSIIKMFNYILSYIPASKEFKKTLYSVFLSISKTIKVFTKIVALYNLLLLQLCK